MKYTRVQHAGTYGYNTFIYDDCTIRVHVVPGTAVLRNMKSPQTLFTRYPTQSSGRRSTFCSGCNVIKKITIKKTYKTYVVFLSINNIALETRNIVSILNVFFLLIQWSWRIFEKKLSNINLVENKLYVYFILTPVFVRTKITKTLIILYVS